MRSARPILLAVIATAIFYYVTTYAGRRWEPTASRPDKVEIIEAAGPQQLDGEEANNVEVYRKVLPSVVNITSTAVSYDFFYGPVPEQGQGSGFVFDREGHILTNYHVVANARRLEVTLSNRQKYSARVIGLARSHDLAVIKIDAPNLTPATLGDSSGLLVGQKVFAIGNPFGLEGTMTRGIISSIRAVRRPDGVTIEEAIQTDASINPGNSGGPLLNSRGEVIGINTFIFSQVGQSAGINFAIPINAAKAVLNDLVTIGRVRRPSLGIRGLPISPALADEIGLAADNGILVMEVFPGGAAERAGLRGGTERAYLGNIPIRLGGDLIVELDGEEIRDLQDVARVMNRRRAGDRIRVTFYRGQRRMQAEMVLGEALEQT